METRTDKTDLFAGRTFGELLAEGFEELAATVKVGKHAVQQRFTCHTVALDLNPTSYNPKLVKKTRKILSASQALFAQFLGVSVKTVRAWEQGANPPRDAACRLMDEIRHDPTYWRSRLAELTIAKPARKRSKV